MILITQLSSMIVIGLWLNITWNLELWGAWDGLGVFVKNRYSDWFIPRLSEKEDKLTLQKILTVINVTLTFHFVALGWIWFALPEVSLSLRVFLRLLGMGG